MQYLPGSDFLVRKEPDMDICSAAEDTNVFLHEFS